LSDFDVFLDKPIEHTYIRMRLQFEYFCAGLVG
jgi:hypothetical protein